jgi:glycine/D-amino acid oxidase-like deaminating enzyme/nitrite reductase/ring-hydroxylating ferredoxin subunit
MEHQSLWRAHELPRFQRTNLPTEIDVAIVGGGITGLTAAYLLKNAGKRVAVFERDHIGAGETGNTSAHVTHVTDGMLTELEKTFGRSAAQRVWSGGARAIDLIESIVSARAIGCQFQRVPGFRCAPFFDDKGEDAESLEKEAELARELGFDATFHSVGPIAGRACNEVANQAIIHPLDYLLGLALAIDGDGSYICENAEVGEVTQDPLGVTVNGEMIACNDVLIATNVPILGSTNLFSATLFQTKIYPYSSYVLGARVDADVLAPGLYWDTADPYYYLRIHDVEGGRYAVFGGKDHKTGQETDIDARYAALEDALKTLIPSAKVEYRWSGQVVETVDGLPFIGQTAEHQWSATGYSGTGIMFGTLAGMMMHDAVVGRSNPWRDIFDPNRKASTLSAITEYIAENVDYPYYLVADRLTEDRSATVDSIQPGDGKVLSIGGKHVACHRTASGELQKVSAVCTHMGCLVRWNGGEQTWDCPCHGSRFTPDGLVLGGPAETPLGKVDG